MEKMAETASHFLEIPEHGFDAERVTSQIEAVRTEAAEYLEQWRTKLGLPALSQPDLELDLSDPIWEWSTQMVDDCFKWYSSTILPGRTEEGLAPVWAHGAECQNLFKGGKNLQEWAGIISTGKVRGQFGLFERYDKEFTEEGWRCRKGAIQQRMASDCWVLTDDKNAREQNSMREKHQFNSFSVVFIDPRTHQWYLEELKQRIGRGEKVTPHTALRLDQLQAHIKNHRGRFPFEVERLFFLTSAN